MQQSRPYMKMKRSANKKINCKQQRQSNTDKTYAPFTPVPETWQNQDEVISEAGHTTLLGWRDIESQLMISHKEAIIFYLNPA